MADSALRKIELLKRIPRQPRFMTTARLHDIAMDLGYRVSRRQIQRDISKLRYIFPNLVSARVELEGRHTTGYSFQSRDYPAFLSY